MMSVTNTQKVSIAPNKNQQANVPYFLLGLTLRYIALKKKKEERHKMGNILVPKVAAQAINSHLFASY